MNKHRGERGPSEKTTTSNAGTVPRPVKKVNTEKQAARASSSSGFRKGNLKD